MRQGGCKAVAKRTQSISRAVSSVVRILSTIRSRNGIDGFGNSTARLSAIMGQNPSDVTLLGRQEGHSQGHPIRRRENVNEPNSTDSFEELNSNAGSCLRCWQRTLRYFARSIKAPAARNRARSTLSAFFGWAIGEGLCDVNPVVGTNKAHENEERKRDLSEEEIAAVWLNADKANGYGTILKLLLLTGCRRDEIGGLRWSEIDLNARTITLPGSRTKNKQEHVIPLSDMAMSVLAGIPKRDGREFVFGRTMGAGFSGWSSAKREFDEVCQIEAWRLHDLRRTMATQMAELGVLPHIIEACINHISGHKSGVAGVYNRATYLPEKRKALGQWAHHLRTIVAQKTGANVTTLSPRRSPR